MLVYYHKSLHNNGEFNADVDYDELIKSILMNQ